MSVTDLMTVHTVLLEVAMLCFCTIIHWMFFQTMIRIHLVILHVGIGYGMKTIKHISLKN